MSSAVAEALEVLEKRCDVLLIVTPPLLAAGDAMTIASHADALILVAGIDRVRREALVETRRVLERCPTFTLGVIATGAKATERGTLPPALCAPPGGGRAGTRRPTVGDALRPRSPLRSARSHLGPRDA